MTQDFTCSVISLSIRENKLSTHEIKKTITLLNYRFQIFCSTLAALFLVLILNN